MRPKEEHEIIQTIRKQQDTDEWKERYNTRAGIEGTLSQGVNAFELAAPEQEVTIETLNPQLTETAIAIVEESDVKIPEVFVDDVALDVALTLEFLVIST